MRPRYWFVLIPIAMGGSALWSIANAITQPAAATAPSSPTRFFGNAGCAAMGCHNSMEPAGTLGSEYSTWAGSDPHTRAYGVLFRPDAVRMERLYRKLPANVEAAAHNDELCLKCHAPMGIRQPELKNDAVGCEACHGGSEQWRTTHYLNDWKLLDAAGKSQRGLCNTKDLVGRVQMCAKCHVGAPGMEVDHDLIAAGHPRLFFDYAAYHELLPRHWKEKDEASFPAKAWAVGRMTAAHSSMELLHHRAHDAHRWPELSEFNCYSCHRGLTGQTSPPSNKPIGALGANTWNLALLAELGVDPSPVNQALQGLSSPAPKIAGSAAQLRDQLASRIRSLNPEQFDRAWAKELAIKLTTKPQNIGDWDAAAQHYLALSALDRAVGSTKKRRSALNSMRDTLRFAPCKNSPNMFLPDKYFEFLRQLNWDEPSVRSEGGR